jgi:signal transduction histidine kinase
VQTHSLRRTVVTTLGVGLLLLMGVWVIAYRSMGRLIDTSIAVERTHHVLRLLESTYSRIGDAETASRSYVLTGDERYLEPANSARRGIAATLIELQTLAQDSPSQRERLTQLAPLLARRLAVLDHTVALRREQGFDMALAFVRSGRGTELRDSVRAAIDALATEEERRLTERSRGEQSWAFGVTVAIALALACASGLGVAAVLEARRHFQERAAASAALQDAKEAAEAASRAKTDFLARMSHELRTPLNSVIGFSNVVLRQRGEALGADGRTYLERVRDNGVHLLLMIDDLLDVSRIEVGRIALSPAQVAVEALASEVLGSFEMEARRKGLALCTDFPSEPACVEADPARLRQVLVNLVGNAVKFTHQGSVTVRVVADPRTGAAERVEVRDTGIGIPADRQRAIFEAFEQADTSTVREFGGTGLGLAISSSLCELRGFQLGVVSAPGAGSTFTIVLTEGAAYRG